jgi:nitrite reductase/ring-hydroxylating ferredoxin subunit
MTQQPGTRPTIQGSADSGQYFRRMAEFIGFSDADADNIYDSRFIVEKHIPRIIGEFYAQLLRYPATRKYFLKKDGTIDQEYLQLRMHHQFNFWRKTAAGDFSDEFAQFVDYVGKAHTSHGADPRIYIPERYVIGMVGFVQHAISEALEQELHEVDPAFGLRAARSWNRLIMVLLELLARAYGNERVPESYESQEAIQYPSVMQLAVETYERGLGVARSIQVEEVAVARVDEIPNGQRKIVQVGDLSIGVFHHKGEWYALHNSCLHRGGPVCTGTLEGDTLVCPWHGYPYDITNGQITVDRSAALPSYLVEIKDGEVWLKIPRMIRDEVEITLDVPRYGTAKELDPEFVGMGTEEGGQRTEDGGRETEDGRQKTGDGGQKTGIDGSGLAGVGTAEAVQAAASGKVTLAENEFNVTDVPPGKMKVVKVKGEAVVVYNVDGKFYATINECTHVGAPLDEGELEGTTITCPWHFSCFDVTSGKVTCGPADEDLRVYKVEVVGEMGRVL